MGGISSINFKKTKNAVQTSHNDRSIAPYYLLPSEDVLKAKGGVEVNRSAEQADAFKSAIVAKAMEDYQRAKGQRFQAKSYLWSAVVNIKPDTTMQDLEKLADHFKTKYGFQCYQIAIHRDEGYKDEEGAIHINHHAHLEFVTLEEGTGLNMYRKEHITRQVARNFQTETANILGMQRGVDVRQSGRKRIEPRAYGKLMNETRQKYETEKQKLKSHVEKTENIYRIILKSDLFTQQEKAGLMPAPWESFEEATRIQVNRAVKRLTDRETTLTQERENLETTKAEIKTAILDLASVVDELREKNPLIHLGKSRRLTGKELAGLCGEVRKHMIATNKELAELKPYQQEHYRAVSQLKQQDLTISELKAKLAEIDEQATKEIKALRNANATQAGEISELQKSIAERDKKYHTALRMLNDKGLTIIELESAQTKSTAELTEAHKSIETLQATNTTQTARIKELESALQAQEEAKADTTALESLRTEYEAVKEKYEEAKEQIKNLKEVTFSSKDVDEFFSGVLKPIYSLAQQKPELANSILADLFFDIQKWVEMAEAFKPGIDKGKWEQIKLLFHQRNWIKSLETYLGISKKADEKGNDKGGKNSGGGYQL